MTLRVSSRLSSARLDSLIFRSYTRLRWRFMIVIAAIGAVNAAIAAGVTVVISLDALEATATEMLHTGLLALLLSLLSVVTLYLFAKPRFYSAFQWVTSPDSAAQGPVVWRIVTREIDWLILAGVGVFSVWFLPFPLFIWSYLDQPASVIPITFAVVELAILFAATLDFFAVGRMLRPVLREVGPSLPIDFEPSYTTASLTVRILAVSTVVGVFGAYVASNATRADSPVVQVAVSLGVAIGVMAVLGIPASMLLSESITTPLNAVLDATRRIEQGDLSARVPLLGADEVGRLSAAFNRMAKGLEERESLRSAFGSYIDPAVANHVIEQGAVLEGHEREISVMFVDIRGFTARSEHQTPQETVRVLNEFFDVVVPVVNDHAGVVNKFLGDGFLAVFGAPIEVSDHADRAVECARALQQAVRDHDGERLAIGIGVNTGPVVVGSIGGGGRLEFGLIGDVVNVSARVQELTKSIGSPILLTDSTRCRLSEVDVQLATVGPTAIRGRNEPVVLYAIHEDGRSRTTSAESEGLDHR